MNHASMDDDFEQDDDDDDNPPPESEDSAFPFSDEVLRLVQQIKTTSNKSDRLNLMAELASTFAAEHDETDESATDVYHDYIDEYHKAQVDYQQAALRLARLAIQCVDTVLRESQISIEDVLTKRMKTIN